MPTRPSSAPSDPSASALDGPAAAVAPLPADGV